MNNKYIISAVAAGSLAVVAGLIISLSSSTGMTGTGAPKSVSPHIDQSRVPHSAPPAGQGHPTPSIQQGTPGKAGSLQQVPQSQRTIAYDIEQPDTLPPQQQPDPTQDPLMPPKQKPKSEQPPVQRQLLAQGTEQGQQPNPYMPPIQEPMPSYGTQQQQMQEQQMQEQQIQERQIQGQQIQQQQQPNYYNQTEPQYIEQVPPESCTPPPAETIPNASSSFQPPTPVVPPSPQI